MTEDEKEVLKECARHAVHETFLYLGVDVEKREEVKDLQLDLTWLRTARESGAEVGKMLKKAAIGSIVAGTLIAIWIGIKTKLLM